MKFEDKFPNMIPIEETDEGMMRDVVKCKCTMCDNLTDFIDICSEAYFCSEECMEKFYRDFWTISK